jgi:hypothetical protein
MKKTRFTEEQMVTILREADEKSVPEVAKKHRTSARDSRPREYRAEAGEPGRNRTVNPQIKSLLLCQLSYRPTWGVLGV